MSTETPANPEVGVSGDFDGLTIRQDGYNTVVSYGGRCDPSGTDVINLILDRSQILLEQVPW